MGAGYSKAVGMNLAKYRTSVCGYLDLANDGFMAVQVLNVCNYSEGIRWKIFSSNDHRYEGDKKVVSTIATVL